MYIFTFVILLLAAIGVYTNAYFQQSAKMSERQDLTASSIDAYNKVIAADTTGNPAGAGTCNRVTAAAASLPNSMYSMLNDGGAVYGTAFSLVNTINTVKCNVAGTIITITAFNVANNNQPIAGVGLTVAELDKQFNNMNPPMLPGTYGRIISMGPTSTVIRTNVGRAVSGNGWVPTQRTFNFGTASGTGITNGAVVVLK